MNSTARPSLLSLGLVSLLLIGLNVAAYGLQGLQDGQWIDRTADAQIDWGGNLALLSLTGDTWRLPASMFLHGGLLHLAMNMYMLFLIGPAAERQFGRLGMLLLYLGGGLAGSCASAWWTGSHLVRQLTEGGGGQWMIVSVGASGALMALCGGLLGAVLLGRAMGHRPLLGEGFGKSLGQVVLINVVAGAAISGVDQAAHIGGLTGGALIGLLMTVGGGREGGAVAQLSRFAAPLLVGAASVWLVTSAMDWATLRELRQQRDEYERGRGEQSGQLIDRGPAAPFITAALPSTAPVDKLVPKPCPASASACQHRGFVPVLSV